MARNPLRFGFRLSADERLLPPAISCSGSIANYPVKTTQIATKTKAEIAAEFAQGFKGIKPDEAPKKLTQADRLAPYKTQVLKKRRAGFSWKLIAERMSQPPINQKVSERTLIRLFGATEAAAKTARRAPKTAKKAAPTQPSLPRLVLDRATGLPIDQVPAKTPPAAPAAKPSRLPPRWQPVFDRIAPKILSTGAVDDVAIGFLVAAIGKDLHAETEEMNAFVKAAMAEFDAMDRDTAMVKYQMKAADWDDWRPRWCELREIDDYAAKR